MRTIKINKLQAVLLAGFLCLMAISILMPAVTSAQTVQPHYCIDVLEQGNPGGWGGISLKTFDASCSVELDNEFIFDIWLCDVPPSAWLQQGATEVDFVTDISKLLVVDGAGFADGSNVAVLPGPWTIAILSPDYYGPGTLVISVFSSGVQPDADGDIIIARIKMKRIESGDAHIHIVSDYWYALNGAVAPADLTVTELPEESPAIISVPFDIKPGSCLNPTNSKSKGVLPAAIMGLADLDVFTIDPASIRLTREGVDGAVAPIRWSYDDAGSPCEEERCDCDEIAADVYIDMELKFDAQEVINTLHLAEVAGQTVPLTLTGMLTEEFGGLLVSGEDCVRVKK